MEDMEDIQQILAGLEDELARDPSAVGAWLSRYPRFREELLRHAAYRALLGREEDSRPPDRAMERRFRGYAKRAWQAAEAEAPAKARAAGRPVAAHADASARMMVSLLPPPAVVADAAAPMIASLIQVAAAAGLTVAALAQKLRLSVAETMKLERRLILPESIPSLLKERLARVIRSSPEEVSAYLSLRPMLAAGASYRSKEKPEVSAQTFREALETSPSLGADDREYWLEVTRNHEAGRG